MSFLGPLIRGTRFDFSSVELNINGTLIQNVQDINYSETLEPGIERGTSAKKLGRSRGVYDGEGSITMSKGAAQEVLALLAVAGTGGYGENPFSVTVIYHEIGETPITDELIQCRVKSVSDGHSTGGDVLQVELQLDVMEIKRNGVSMVRALP